MSDAFEPSAANLPPDQPATRTPRRRGPGRRLVRVLAWTAGVLILLLLIVVAGLSWYTTTPDFQRRVGAELVSVLEDATGGKVEIGHVSFDLWHLAVEVDGLVIHGLEGPAEAPYLAAEKILVRIKLLNFLAHSSGTGKRTYFSVNYLRVDAPHVHLIIDKNGKTNQPVPRQKTQSNEPVTDTLLDLKANDVELVHGLAVVNDRAIPFNLAASDLNAQVNYLYASDRYAARVDLRDLRTQMQKAPEVKSSLFLEAELGRDAALLKRFEFHSGEHSILNAKAAINHFDHPEWQAKLTGTLELKQVSLLAAVDGLDAGSVDLDIGGHNCFVAPAEAQKKPRFIDRFRSKKEAATNARKTLPPDPDCQQGYLLVGSARLHDAAYNDASIHLHNINGGAQVHITPTELLLTALTGYLPGGGSATGQLKIDNWLGEVQQNTPTSSATVKGATTTANKTSAAITGKAALPETPVVAATASAHAYLTVTADRIPLRAVLEATQPRGKQDLGFDTAASGPVKVEWGGPIATIGNSVVADADVTLSPTGVRGPRGVREIPVSGRAVAHYDGRGGVVDLRQAVINTPQSTLTAAGVIGATAGSRATAVTANLTVRDLGEFDQLLRTYGVSSNGKKGAAAIPIALHGAASFHGTAAGPFDALDIKGHLEASNLEVRLGDLAPPAPAAPAKPNLIAVAAGTAAPAPVAAPPPTDIHIDSIIADAEYTPSGLAVARSTVRQGSAVLKLAGSFKPRAVTRHRATTYVWDNGTAVDVNVQLANANVVDVLTIAGQQQQIPLTGTVSVNGHAAGTLKALNGTGNISLTNGIAYGEPYESANVDLSVRGQDIEASRVALRLHGMAIDGNGGYDLTSRHVHLHLQGNNLQLSKFKTVQDANLNADGVLTLVADANGTLEQPNLKANLHLANLQVQGKPIGESSIDAHSEARTVFYSLRSTLVGAQVAGDGQTELTGSYNTQAKLALSNLDIARPLALFAPGGTQAHSNIAGTVTISGPAKTPMALAGQAQFSSFEVSAQGLTFRAAEPLRLGLRNGVATLDAVHITGPDTDLRASGTAQVFAPVDPRTGVADPNARRLDVKALGSVNVALVHTLDPDILTQGKVVFSIAASGVLANPVLAGNVDIQHVNAAVDGIANGLTDLNGRLVFTQNRLTVQSLTATTGGGKLNVGGFLTYRNGVYADLTATGDNVRVRYNGLSSTANTNFRLQGSLSNALLSGNILLTRFGVGPDVDFAAFSSGGGVSAPPDPASATNKIHLDIHVTSSPQLDFQNSYAKLSGTVDLTVRGTVADPSVLGRVQITDGSATFAGTKYQLQRGDIYFSNPVRIDPVIDLDATARVETYDVTVGVHGTASNLKPTYRSEPPLSEADIFALLALGRTQEESQIYQEQQVAAGTDPTTNSLLSGALNATVSSRVSKLFGGGSVKIDPAFVGTLGNSSARITVQQQLSRQITLTYATSVNSSTQQLIQVQYQLSPNVSIVAARDESGVFSIVYRIRRRYR